MKKSILGILLISIPLIWYGESRKFFRLTNGNYVTLWKTYGNLSFIIPGKYYGIVFPGRSHIETSNVNFISIYQRKNSRDTLFFESRYDTKINNATPNEPVLANVKLASAKDLSLILETERSQRDFDNWSLLNLEIKESYARDENGVIQR
ncbi:hypothetical protein [Chryseolinea lacunae]|uniref:Uncharacterized protein n=1 Tax=Chryseolinea lacunae TaxID=2801331 RepID=A0ABS1KVK2_9BACT|nr:hypothetical protein [Chryseolinea lacunae]MBL0743491.1 hypothetical protein [Chryseolinea lacunae]